ncbi:MAG: FAD assembly factor SdhE [Gallionella sp.]
MKNKSEDLGFGIEDLGLKSQSNALDITVASGLPNPKSPIPNPDVPNLDLLRRMQWRARRGLLELDLFLQPFVAAHYSNLNEAELLTFEALLDMPDNTLWDMMSGRKKADNLAQQQLLEKIKSL